MPRKRDAVKAGAPVPRIRENSRLMRTHESMIDFISGRDSGNSLLDVLAPAFFGYDFLRPLEDDLIYSDSDDDGDDDYDHDFRHAANQPLQPHPQIKQLTDEEADKIAKELIEEEERVKGKTEKNKRKKMRKKEKKRLEKKNAIKDNVSEGVQDKSDSSENQEKESPVTENKEEASKSVMNECIKSQNASEEADCDKHSDDIKEEISVKTKKKEDEQLKNLDLDNSSVSPAKSVPEEMRNQEPTEEKKEEKSEILQVQPPEEEKPKAAEKPEVPKNKDEKQKNSMEKTVASAAEDYAKRSIELASMGNRLAASGQYEIAVRCFTDAIKFNPKEYKLFGNRSLCYERMQQYENALRDADLAVSMESNWIKGLFRKGKALCGLKRYYEASLVYKEVLKLESTSLEALQELKRAQTLHLMEMGFTWAQSSEALKTHATLEEAVEALFAGESNSSPADVSASSNKKEQPVMPEEEEDGGEWTVLQPSRPRMQHVNVSDALGQNRSNSQSLSPRSRNSVKPELFSVWVGFLAPAVTYTRLHELFSRTGTVYSIKMLLEHQCAFVSYTSKEDCERAIQCINGMVVEGAPLTVRYPYKNHTDFGASFYKKECFFWRTTGCTRSDCTYKHVPENKNIDRDKFTSRLGYVSHAGDQK